MLLYYLTKMTPKSPTPFLLHEEEQRENFLISPPTIELDQKDVGVIVMEIEKL